ncbi:hypothetical protein ABH944_006792 [Caballeronia udeis]|jgi:hypothetical protein|uniref:Uncharacterized protein n=1 Tax=Caballeronia udeis TaxID=1232866 RepID=A0ABW8MSC5_9BURK
MIADRTGRTDSFLAARVKSRLRFAVPTGHKARLALAHRAFRPRGREQTVSDGSDGSDGSWPDSAGSRESLNGYEAHVPCQPVRIMRSASVLVRAQAGV